MKISKARGLNEEEGEDVEFVTSGAQLRTGAVVWITPCGRCGGHHRTFLGNAQVRKVLHRGALQDARGYLISPTPRCLPTPEFANAMLFSDPWDAGPPRVYRVIDGMAAGERTRHAIRTADSKVQE